MIDVLVGLIPSAVAIALSPMAIIQLILVLFSKRARVNGAVFLATLVVAVFGISLLGALVVDVATDESTDQPSTVKGWVFTVLGVALLLVAIQNWRKRKDTSAPKVLDAIANMGPLPVLVLALGVAAFNPKNTIMLLAAGAQAGGSGETMGAVVASLLLFTLIATSPFSVAVGYAVFGGAPAQVRLERFRAWLTAHNRIITAVVLGIVGLVLAIQGLTAL